MFIPHNKKYFHFRHKQDVFIVVPVGTNMKLWYTFVWEQFEAGAHKNVHGYGCLCIHMDGYVRLSLCQWVRVCVSWLSMLRFFIHRFIPFVFCMNLLTVSIIEKPLTFNKFTMSSYYAKKYLKKKEEILFTNITMNTCQFWCWATFDSKVIFNFNYDVDYTYLWQS